MQPYRAFALGLLVLTFAWNARAQSGFSRTYGNGQGAMCDFGGTTCMCASSSCDCLTADVCFCDDAKECSGTGQMYCKSGSLAGSDACNWQSNRVQPYYSYPLRVAPLCIPNPDGPLSIPTCTVGNVSRRIDGSNGTVPYSCVAQYFCQNGTASAGGLGSNPAFMSNIILVPIFGAFLFILWLIMLPAARRNRRKVMAPAPAGYDTSLAPVVIKTYGSFFILQGPAMCFIVFIILLAITPTRPYCGIPFWIGMMFLIPVGPLVFTFDPRHNEFKMVSYYFLFLPFVREREELHTLVDVDPKFSFWKPNLLLNINSVTRQPLLTIDTGNCHCDDKRRVFAAVNPLLEQYRRGPASVAPAAGGGSASTANDYQERYGQPASTQRQPPTPTYVPPPVTPVAARPVAPQPQQPVQPIPAQTAPVQAQQPLQARFCGQCGASTGQVAGARFCPQCGATLYGVAGGTAV